VVRGGRACRGWGKGEPGDVHGTRGAYGGPGEGGPRSLAGDGQTHSGAGGMAPQRAGGRTNPCGKGWAAPQTEMGVRPTAQRPEP
jgi:hypothetical protein